MACVRVGPVIAFAIAVTTKFPWHRKAHERYWKRHPDDSLHIDTTMTLMKTNGFPEPQLPYQNFLSTTSTIYAGAWPPISHALLYTNRSKYAQYSHQGRELADIMLYDYCGNSYVKHATIFLYWLNCRNSLRDNDVIFHPLTGMVYAHALLRHQLRNARMLIFLLIWINSILAWICNYIHYWMCMGWTYLYIIKLQWCYRWSLGIDK